MNNYGCKDLWISLIDIAPINGNFMLEGGKGAFTNVIMFASSKKEYINNVKLEFYALDYLVINVDDIELFYERSNSYVLRKELLELATFVENTGKIGIDQLHIYEAD